MKVKITEAQLYAPLTEEQKQAAGYTADILEVAKLPNIRLLDCLIGEIIEESKGVYIINPNFSNPNKLPRKVAYNDLTEDQKQYWIDAVGEENIIIE